MCWVKFSCLYTRNYLELLKFTKLKKICRLAILMQINMKDFLILFCLLASIVSGFLFAVELKILLIPLIVCSIIYESY